MSIRVEADCDECGTSIEEGYRHSGECYCHGCYQQLKDDNEEMENQIAELREQLEQHHGSSFKLRCWGSKS